MTTREQIFQALFGLVSLGEGLPGTVTWSETPANSFAYTSRRFQMWPDLPGMPALIQSEPDEVFVRGPAVPAKRLFGAAWMVLHNIGQGSVSMTPTQFNNIIIDALEAAIAPQFGDPGYPSRQTLGGLVSHCWIEGKILKIPGDLDDQALISVPIKILAP